jgi:hypothetical protein
MPKLTPDLDPSRCACGREVTEADSVSYSASSGRYVFHRCECGAEWTQQLDHVDRSAPVSTDEVLEVHERLAAFRGSINDLLGLSPAT